MVKARLTGPNKQTGNRGIKPVHKPAKGTPVKKPGSGCGCGA